MAKLSLLHAQVEPHFLYNTLASAQVLTRSDPARADQYAGPPHRVPAQLGAARRRIRSRPWARSWSARAPTSRSSRSAWAIASQLQIQVPGALKAVPMPPMMLQTLVENAIKHGLEPVTGGGTVWIIAREADGKAIDHRGRRRPRLQRRRRRHGHRLEERPRAPAPRLRRCGLVRHRRQFPQGRGCDNHGAAGEPMPKCVIAEDEATAARRPGRAARRRLAGTRSRRGLRGWG